MRAGNTGLAALIILAGATGAVAQTRHYSVTVRSLDPGAARGFEKLHLSKATVGTAEIRLWANTAIDPDCQAMNPAATLRILKPPAHGVARISDEPFYAAFPPNNPRAACNTRKIPGHQAFYAAEAGFTGHDHVVLEGSSPDGRVREISVDVEVR